MYKFANEFTDDTCKGVVAEWLNRLSDEEIIIFANKLLDGYRPCPRCKQLCAALHIIPKKFQKYFRSAVRYNPQMACNSCIAGLTTRYNEAKEKENKELAGSIKLNFRVFAPDKRNKKGGVIYLCRHKGICKIGASTNPHWRLYAQGYRPFQFICAIETYYPFDLEKYLHGKFGRKRITTTREHFDLDEKDINFIKGIKIINEMPAYCYKDIDSLEGFPVGLI